MKYITLFYIYNNYNNSISVNPLKQTCEVEIISISILQIKKLRPGKASTLSTVTVSKLWNGDFFLNTTKFGIWKQHDKNRKEWRRTEDTEKTGGESPSLKKKQTNKYIIRTNCVHLQTLSANKTKRCYK